MLKQLALLTDIECFSTLPNAAVSEVSLLLIDLSSGTIIDSITSFFNPYDQIHSHIDESTKQWCLEKLPQENLKKSFASNTKIELPLFISKIQSLINRNSLVDGNFRIYSRGSNFDLPIITSLIASVNGGKPHGLWDFRSEYCHRTVLEIAFNNEELLEATKLAEDMSANFLNKPLVKHDSSHDVVLEAFLLHLAFKKIETSQAVNLKVTPKNQCMYSGLIQLANRASTSKDINNA